MFLYSVFVFCFFGFFQYPHSVCDYILYIREILLYPCCCLFMCRWHRRQCLQVGVQAQFGPWETEGNSPQERRPRWQVGREGGRGTKGAGGEEPRGHEQDSRSALKSRSEEVITMLALGHMCPCVCLLTAHLTYYQPDILHISDCMLKDLLWLQYLTAPVCWLLTPPHRPVGATSD